MIIEPTRKFVKTFSKTPAKIQLAFEQRIELFRNSPFHPLLNNHALTGKYAGFRSINITGDWRVVFREFDNYHLVSLETIGTHSQLYK
jgi:addiction module RelE/StbE family toxin